MTLRFDQPWFFVGMLVCLPMAWAALRWFVSMSAPRRWSAIVLRFALVGVLLAMLAGASTVRRSDRVAVIACVDMSGSVRRFFDPGSLGTNADGTPITLPGAIRKFLNTASSSRRPDDLSGVVVFGERPMATGLVDGSAFRLPDEWPDTESATNIEQSLRLAGAMIPPDAAGRIIVFTDGVQTRGSAELAARSLGGGTGAGAAQGTGGTASGGAGAAAGDSARGPSGTTAPGRKSIRIDAVPLNYAVDREVVLESVDSPPTAQSGATVPVRVVLSATQRCTGALELLREGVAVNLNDPAPARQGQPPAGSALRLTLEPGRNVEVFNVPLPDERIHRFEAIWTPDAGDAGADTILANNRAESVTVAPGRGAVLIVDGVSGGESQGAGSVLASALSKSGLQVQSIGPDGLRPDLLWLQQFDLIVLQNVAADAVTRSTHGALATCVTQLGVGLIMVGGPESFGAGGWKGTEIEPILPVKLDLPERLVTPAAAVILIIDNSGSMNRPVLGSNRSQQDIADEGAALAVESMDKSDLVGVITFNSDYTVDVPLGPNRDAKATARLIRSIGADGGTNMPPALGEAHTQIKTARADIKHVIVLSDGVSQGKEQLPAMVENMAADGIIVSTIAIGNDADVTVMRDMARLGKGQFYRVIDPTILPRVLLKAVRIVRSPLVREGLFTPIVLPSGSPVMDGLSQAFGIDGNGIPPLGGLVLTQARTEPTVVYTLATPKREGADGGGEPVLGYWSAGLGRVAVFTSDAHAKWAAPWLDANGGAGYSRFWTQLARTIARPPSDRTQELSTEIDGDRLTIRLHASEEGGKPIDALAVPGSIYTPDGAKMDLRLSQVGPGDYEQSFDLRPIASSSGPGTDGAALAAGLRSSNSLVVTLSPRRTIGGHAKSLPPVIAGITRPPGEEYRRLRSDPSTLKSIADAAGGEVFNLGAGVRADISAAAHPGTTLPGVPDLFSRKSVVPAEARTPLWPMLAVAAVALLLLDVATRRIAWDRLISREMTAEVRRGVGAALRDRTTQAAFALERLRAPQVSPSTTPLADSPAPLGDADADALRAREQSRRREQRSGIRRATHEPASAAPIDPLPEKSGENEATSGDQSGLRAAKRRAQKRMDEE